MKIVRSILAIVVGAIVAAAVVSAAEAVNFFLFRPENMSIEEFGKVLRENPKKVADWIKTLPVEALVVVLAGWAVGAFLGGLVAALIAGRARCWHAGIIGGFVLLGAIYNFYDMKNRYDLAHPDWMIVAGLLLPLPMSLLAGKLVSMLFPAATN
jgi:hypothetical protein